MVNACAMPIVNTKTDQLLQPLKDPFDTLPFQYNHIGQLYEIMVISIILIPCLLCELRQHFPLCFNRDNSCARIVYTLADQLLPQHLIEF